MPDISSILGTAQLYELIHPPTPTHTPFFFLPESIELDFSLLQREATFLIQNILQNLPFIRQSLGAGHTEVRKMWPSLQELPSSAGW